MFAFLIISLYFSLMKRIVSDNDKEMPQSQTADNPMAPRRRVTQQSLDTRKTH